MEMEDKIIPAKIWNFILEYRESIADFIEDLISCTKSDEIEF